MWPPPLSLRCSALLIPTHKVWSLECGHIVLVPRPPLRIVLQHVPSKPCFLKHLHTSSRRALGHTMPSLYAMLSTLGTWAMPLQICSILSQENHIAMLVISQGAEETWISCHRVGTGTGPLESLALDWLAQGPSSFSSTEGLQTQPLSLFTWSSFIPSDGAFTSTLMPVVSDLCPWGGVGRNLVQEALTGTADSDACAEPAATETRLDLPTHRAALRTQSTEG